MAKKTLEINLAGVQVSKDDQKPLYAQVYEQLLEMILSSRIRPGDRLPATRELSKAIGVSRTIITQSFEQLILEGYLIGKSGSGTFIADKLPDHLMKAGDNSNQLLENTKRSMPEIEVFSSVPEHVFSCCSTKEEVTPFQRGTPSFDFFPYKLWQEAGNKVLKSLKKFHLGYENTLGYYPLRQQIASYLRMTRAVKCEADQVIVVTGSQQGLNLTIKCLLKPGDQVVYEDPGYQSARLALLNAGMKMCPVPVQEDGINIKYAKENFPDANFIFITPSHQYPLGCTLSLSKRLELLDWAQTNKVWIFEDDYDSEFRYEGTPLASLQGLDKAGNVIYLGTFSKVLFPGLQLAYIVLPSAEMVGQMQKVKAFLDRQSPIMDQLILTEFMREGHFLRHIRKMRLLYEKRQEMLVKLMTEYLSDYISLQPFPGGMSFTGWLSPKIDLTKLKEEVKKQGLTVHFLSDYSEKHFAPPGISLGYTAFSKYKLNLGVEKLTACVLHSLKA